MPGRTGDGDGCQRPFGIARGELQRLHRAHRPTDHAKQPIYAQMVEQPDLDLHHIMDGDDREGQSPRLAGGRVDGGRAGRPHAAAQHIRAQDEIPVGIQHLTRADQMCPPARPARYWVGASGELISGQRMANQDGVRAIRV